jgi:hypothetical protein
MEKPAKAPYPSARVNGAAGDGQLGAASAFPTRHPPRRFW